MCDVLWSVFRSGVCWDTFLCEINVEQMKVQLFSSFQTLKILTFYIQHCGQMWYCVVFTDLLIKVNLQNSHQLYSDAVFTGSFVQPLLFSPLIS